MKKTAKRSHAWREKLRCLLAATITFGAAHGVWATDLYWVGGEGGLWVGDNWADAADGTGAAWVDGSRGVFTTSPSAVALAGFSPTATYLTGSGFSAGNLCEIAVTNALETVPTLTLTSAASDFTVATFSNVNVHCTTTGNMGLNNSSHLHLGEGAKFTMASGGRFLVGRIRLLLRPARRRPSRRSSGSDAEARTRCIRLASCMSQAAN